MASGAASPSGLGESIRDAATV